VVKPVAPEPTTPRSSTATETPLRCSSSAVVMPVIPPPMTATSTLRS
jgi:hypothetical protein